MATRKTSQRRKKDPGAIFDAAIARGATVPPELQPDLREFYVEHARHEWTQQVHDDWRAALRTAWDIRQNDPHCRERRSRISAVLQKDEAFWGLDRMPLLCDRGLLHSKLIEALEYALEALELRAESRTVFLRLRKIAEGDLQDARSRKGVDPALFGKREADAMKLLSESRKSLEELENRCPSLLEPVGIINNLTLDLFAIVRHVTPCRSPGALEPVSDKKIHKAVESILKAFAHVNHAVPRRGRGAQVQADPKKRLQRHMKAQQEESAEAARIWRDGRSEETPADQVWRARERLFAWDDDRFDRALFLNT